MVESVSFKTEPKRRAVEENYYKIFRILVSSFKHTWKILNDLKEDLDMDIAEFKKHFQEACL